MLTNVARKEGLVLTITSDQDRATPQEEYSLHMKRCLISGVSSFAVGLPMGWILTMLATPLLWRLEPVLHMELAGHSGPADWVFLVGWAIVIPVVFVIVYFLVLRVEAGRAGETVGNGR